MESPQFFVDRSLGRHRVPEALRQAGWSLTTLAEHYGVPADEDVPDVQWLALAGARRWPVLMKDERIRYRSTELDALVSFGVVAFCLSSGNLTAAEMAHLFIGQRDAIWERASDPRPAVYTLSRAGLRSIDLA